MPPTTLDRIEEIESLARHNCDELAGLTAEIAELQARVEALEGGATTEITEEAFVERFVGHCLAQCGFTHFDDGEPVEAYARKVAPSYWADAHYRADGPEACAEGDMDYWGED
ncbi:hypothetical protein [Rhodovulum kholense]|uniref:Uncharacterized protein n=1 Tax=Rhodovulum kholense TaxID=453584 RepID=A0A8E2VHF3_9RHOB|nr:hypothetical protein [Rhodovulum kholense]PTW45665.1 hypothetical protein C8N38_11366 [Rhodovulum kholense]